MTKEFFRANNRWEGYPNYSFYDQLGFPRKIRAHSRRILHLNNEFFRNNDVITLLSAYFSQHIKLSGTIYNSTLEFVIKNEMKSQHSIEVAAIPTPITTLSPN